MAFSKNIYFLYHVEKFKCGNGLTAIFHRMCVAKFYGFMVKNADRFIPTFYSIFLFPEPRGKKREHIGVVPHLLLAVGYVFLHALLVLLQATTLNVAINSSNKALLTIMMSNNFVELKGSVFKKFDKNNLFHTF